MELVDVELVDVELVDVELVDVGDESVTVKVNDSVTSEPDILN